MTKSDVVLLRHILDCIRPIETNIAEGRERFIASHTLQDAVLRNLQVMAESSQRRSDTSKKKQPQIGWREIAVFRNILVHGYLGIDLEVVWDITQRDVPELKRAAEAILNTLSQEQ